MAADKFSDEQESGRGSYMKPMCMAEGCNMPPEVMTDPDRGIGMCQFHAFAKSSKAWPAVTEITQSYAFAKVWQACRALNAAIRRSPFDETKAKNEAIAHLQNELILFGLSPDDVKQHRVQNFENGSQIVATEDAKAYLYRMRMKVARAVIERSLNQVNETVVDYKGNGRKWTAVALARIARRGREIMGASA